MVKMRRLREMWRLAYQRAVIRRTAELQGASPDEAKALADALFSPGGLPILILDEQVAQDVTVRPYDPSGPYA